MMLTFKLHWTFLYTLLCFYERCVFLHVDAARGDRVGRSPSRRYTVTRTSRSAALLHSTSISSRQTNSNAVLRTNEEQQLCLTHSSRRISVLRGGAAQGVDKDDDESDAWDISVKKVSIAFGVFVLQQALTRILEPNRAASLPSPSVLSKESNILPSLTPPPPPPTPSVAILPKITKDKVPDDTGASMPEHVFNMVKGIVGVGVLSLPSGIAAFGNHKSAILPAVAIISFIGLLSAIGFSWTGEVCDVIVQDKKCPIKTPTYRDAWSYSISEESSWIPAVSTTSMTFIACLCFSMVLADSLTDLVKPIISSAGRTPVLWGVTAIVLLPLCWMKELKSLAPFSLLGVLGMAYTGVAMAGRFLHGSYKLGSPLLQQVPLNMRPSFGNDGWKSVFKPGSITLVSMLSTAYMCHYNAPKFYNELRDNTMPRFNKAVASGFALSILMTCFIACTGFATFGSNSNGFILNNYPPSDVFMSLSRVAVAVSLTFSYPLCFQGLRDGVLDVLQVSPQKRSMSLLNTSTVALLLVLTLLATVLKDVSFVLSLTGATLGNLLCYIFPAIMYGRVNPNVRVAAILLGSTGVILGLIGVKLALE